MQEIITAISSVGFPIIMCLLVFYSNEKTITELKDTISKLNVTLEKILTKIVVEDDEK